MALAPKLQGQCQLSIPGRQILKPRVSPELKFLVMGLRIQSSHLE